MADLEKSTNEAYAHPEIKLAEFVNRVTIKIGPKITSMTAFKVFIQSLFEARGRSYYKYRLNVYLVL